MRRPHGVTAARSDGRYESSVLLMRTVPLQYLLRVLSASLSFCHRMARFPDANLQSSTVVDDSESELCRRFP